MRSRRIANQGEPSLEPAAPRVTEHLAPPRRERRQRHARRRGLARRPRARAPRRRRGSRAGGPRSRSRSATTCTIASSISAHRCAACSAARPRRLSAAAIGARRREHRRRARPRALLPSGDMPLTARTPPGLPGPVLRELDEHLVVEHLAERPVELDRDAVPPRRERHQRAPAPARSRPRTPPTLLPRGLGRDLRPRRSRRPRPARLSSRTHASARAEPRGEQSRRSPAGGGRRPRRTRAARRQRAARPVGPLLLLRRATARAARCASVARPTCSPIPANAAISWVSTMPGHRRRRTASRAAPRSWRGACATTQRVRRERLDDGPDVGRERVDEPNLGRGCDDRGCRSIQRHVRRSHATWTQAQGRAPAGPARRTRGRTRPAAPPRSRAAIAATSARLGDQRHASR